MGGGAWPFLVGGVICLVNSDNERDSNLLNSTQIISVCSVFLEGQTVFSRMCKQKKDTGPTVSKVVNKVE